MNKILRNFSIKNGFCLLAAALVLVTTGCEKTPTDAVDSSEEEVLLTSEAQVYPLTIHATKTAWKATCTENWITLSRTEGIGTENIELTVQANTLSASRTATIQLAMNSGANAKIVVRQQGLSDTEIRVSPEMITAKPYYTAPKYAFTLEVRNKVADPANDITMVVNYMGDSKNWIKNFSIVDVPNSSYHLTSIYSFETEDNIMADAREAEVVFTVKYGHNTYTKTVTVYQNGLGTPAVATAENVYMRHNQTEHTQTIWLNDGDQTNVDYKVEFSSNQSGTGAVPEIANDGWFKAEAVKNAAGDYLKVTSRINTYDETREGDIYVIASRSNNNNVYASTAKLRVHVMQSGHKVAGISLPISEVVHTYVGNNTDVLPYMLPINAINDSKVTASTNADWIHINNPMLENNVLGYTLDQFAGGIAGNFREAVITLRATNGHSNAANYSLTVRQYAPEMPGISLPVSKVSHTYVGNTAPYILPFQQINTSTITASENTDWITITSTAAELKAGELRYKLSEFNGGQAGNFREGVITLLASNDHNEKAMYYVTVCQYAPEMPGISLPVSKVSHTYVGTTAPYILPFQQINTSTITASENADWITITSTAAELKAGELKYELSEFNGGQAGNFREGVITLIASNNHNEKVMYYVTVCQYAPEMPGISLPISKVSYTSVAASYTLPVQPLKGTTLEAATTAANWIRNVSVANGTLTFNLTAYAGGEQGNSREGVITILASNDHADKALFYITVCQYSPETPGISSLPEYIGLGAAATNATLEMNPLNGATIEQVGTPSANWLTASVTGNKLTYSVTANTMAVALNYVREAVITLKASNSNSNVAYYYITVRQYARDMAYLTPAAISMAGHTNNNNTFSPPTPQTITVNNVPQGSINTITWTNSATTGSLINANSNYRFSFAAGSFENQIVVSHSYNGLSGYYNTLSNQAYVYFTVNAYPYKQYLTAPCTMSHTHEPQPIP